MIPHLNKIQEERRVTVSQYTMDGEFIRCFDSMFDAGKTIGISRGNISLCCDGKRNSAGGFKWERNEAVENQPAS